MAAVIVKPEAVSKLRNFYPWIYAHEIQGVEGAVSAGDIVQVTGARGEFICRAFFNPDSHIPGRVLTLDATQKIDRTFFDDRLAAARARREGRVTGTNAMRLVHGEADGLPGLIVDRFADTLVIQLRNHGLDRMRDMLVRALKRVYEPAGIFERSDTQARLEEGLERRVGLVSGDVADQIDVLEDEIHFATSVKEGQKTGFYLDQRDNRRMVASMLRPGDRLLDVYSYTGAFSLHAARAGAQALAVDKDTDALQALETNARRNDLGSRVGVRWGDALEVLGNLAREGRAFTHIVLDPPTLAKHNNDVPRVKQLLSEIVGAALGVLDREGVLLLSSCAYHISVNDLLESIRRAANEARRRLEVLTVTYQPADHPWIIQIPETLYLKSVFVRSL